jgi:hypothetical protein
MKDICRIWDYLLCTGPHGVFFMTAAIILTTKRDLIQHCQEFDVPISIFQEASIQTFYQEQAKNASMDLNLAIREAINL